MRPEFVPIRGTTAGEDRRERDINGLIFEIISCSLYLRFSSHITHHLSTVIIDTKN